MFEQTQFDRLRAWIMAATELSDVIIAHPSAPRPQTDYAVLNLRRSDRIGRPAETLWEANAAHTGVTDLVNAPLWEFVNQEYEFTWSMHIYAKDPINVANRLIPWFHSGAGREMVAPLNLFKLGDPIRVPELINQNWQDRATLDLRVRAYVCTGTTIYDSQQVLLGRVPTDMAEIAKLMMNTRSVDIEKP